MDLQSHPGSLRSREYGFSQSFQESPHLKTGEGIHTRASALCLSYLRTNDRCDIS